MRDCWLKRKLIPIYELVYFTVDNTIKWLVLRTRYRLRIMNSIETLSYIKKHHCSIARYGYGELSFALNIDHEIAFQKNSSELSRRLAEVLQGKNPDLLLCMPLYLNSLKGCTKKCQKYWWDWGKQGDHQKKLVTAIRQHSGRHYLFGDALITRPYMDRQDFAYAEKIFDQLKDLWADQEILIVEGTQTRLGVGNDLFWGATSIKRILAPAVGAFEYYEEIKEGVLQNYSGELVLLALGPTATILASDLADSGIQALDIGHIDIEYEWFLQRQTSKVAIAGKFTNECVDGRNVSDCNDEEYRRQIVLNM